MSKVIQYRSTFGKAPLKRSSSRSKLYAQEEVLDSSVKRSALKRLGYQLTKQHSIRLPSLDHAGESELEILRNLLLLLARGNVQISEPRLLIRHGGSVAKFCDALLNAKRDLTRRKKCISALVTALLQGNEGKVGRPSKATAELISKISALYASGTSCRKIARETGVSRSLVMRVLHLKSGK